MNSMHYLEWFCLSVVCPQSSWQSSQLDMLYTVIYSITVCIAYKSTWWCIVSHLWYILHILFLSGHVNSFHMTQFLQMILNNTYWCRLFNHKKTYINIQLKLSVSNTLLHRVMRSLSPIRLLFVVRKSGNESQSVWITPWCKIVVLW